MPDIRSIRDVADIVEGVEWSALPDHVAEAAERNTLHVLGTTFLGLDRDISKRSLGYARNAAPGNATVITLGATVAPADAAFANATVCHADFRDDAHSHSQSHPGVTVIPAALAAAEILGQPLPPGTIGSAVVAGYQVIGRLGRLGAITSTERGFRASSIYTVFGAAAAAARVLRLDRGGLESALGLAAQQAAGLNQPYFDGTDDWILLPGFAAKAGVTAALLAREGIVAAPRILEGEIGFYRAYADVDLATVVPEGVPDWEIETTRLKTMLTCGWNQATVNALVGAGVKWEEVDTVEAILSPEAGEFPGVANHGPFTTYTGAVLSLPFAIGSLLWNGRLDSTSVADVTRPEVEAAAERVTIRTREDFHGYDTEAVVHYRDGRSETLHVDGSKAQWLLTVPEVKAALEEKFAVAGLDQSLVGELAAAVPGLLSGTSATPVLDVLGRPL
ncbi:MmgE/PrpD family protein [Amycolatopsis sp. Poz14]|uniref:MmgE/PrpD family protein n=1 Tax=Amycolatopsis sp. Poz14 TaxID=1447705 RepID=UPI001EE833F9|nr:MmgE/PrpD family protein [Amycolatopsis sp. Poz14]MCG3754020.1 MmgE/PrpD family protein [Amycolatopsis sp. Poz14]